MVVSDASFDSTTKQLADAGRSLIEQYIFYSRDVSVYLDNLYLWNSEITRTY